jgi:hypothetical protein
VDPETGAANALVFAMYHPAAALRSPGVERDSFEDMRHVPEVLVRARELREGGASPAPDRATMTAAPAPAPAPILEPAPSTVTGAAEPAAEDASQLTLF